jgi:hypothetical protein
MNNFIAILMDKNFDKGLLLAGFGSFWWVLLCFIF